MAVKVHEFYKIYRRQTVGVAMLVQLLSAMLTGALAWVLWQIFNLEPLVAFTFSLIGLLIINIVVTPLLIEVISKPLNVLTQAIAHVSKDPVVTPPPNMNDNYYERTGLKALVQTVYELAVASYPQGEKANAKEAAPSADFFHALAEQSPCGIIGLDQAGKILYANASAPASVGPNNTHQINLVFDQNDDLTKWLAEARANKVRDTHLWQRVADKLPSEEGRRIFDVIGHYQKNNASGIETVLVAFDRTSLYGPDQEDMDFIALAAHELRGPITVIRGYLDVMNEELGSTLNADQQQLIDRLQVSAERLSGYINNILNVSRYDRHQFTMHLHEESLLEVIKTLVPDLALRAKTQNRSLSFHIPENLPSIAADRSGIGEVLTNLIDNAIKYSHQGGEAVISAAQKENAVEITVQDNGIGMPGTVVSNLFNRFYRSHRSRQAVSGTGLGLYICKAIIEAHGGTIWVRSTEGQGTMFGFTIPTYTSVADKIQNGNNSDIIQRSEGWIKNHAMYRR